MPKYSLSWDSTKNIFKKKQVHITDAQLFESYVVFLSFESWGEEVAYNVVDVKRHWSLHAHTESHDEVLT